MVDAGHEEGNVSLDIYWESCIWEINWGLVVVWMEQ